MDWTPNHQFVASEIRNKRESSRWRDKAEIYVSSWGSNEITQLTHNEACDVYPAWSPDQQKIAFLSDRGEESFDLYMMNFDGTDQIRLTYMEENVVQFDWSPDGKRIAFATFDEAKPHDLSEVYVVDIERRQSIQLTDSIDMGEYLPLWSPNGLQVAFLVEHDEQWSISIVNIDNNKPTVSIPIP